jgi:hypothetical protein
MEVNHIFSYQPLVLTLAAESAILVATRTSVTPLWSNNHDPLQMLSSDPAFLGVPATLSDVLGEQDNIRLCEVSLRLELKDPSE